MSNVSTTLSAVIVADGKSFSAWQHDCITELLLMGISVTHFFFQSPSLHGKNSESEKLFPDTRIKSIPLPAAWNNIPAEEISIGSKWNVSCDFILSFSKQSPAIDPAYCRYGVLSFYFGDPSEPSGDQIYSEDVYNGKLACSVSLLCNGDRQLLLGQTWFKTCNFSLEKNLKSAYSRARILLAPAVRGLKNGFHFPEVKPNGVQVNRKPGISFIFMLRMKLLIRLLNHRISHLFFADKWNVGVIERGEFDVLRSQPVSEKIKWMEEKPGISFSADPSALEIKNELNVFFEYYDSQKKKGMIARSLFIKPSFSEEEVCLEGDQHLSYPFVFDFRSMTYCVIESSLENKVALYSIDRDALTIQQESVLLDSFPAVDPTLVFHQSKWWLFCTSRDYKGADLDLYIFYADELHGKYVPHLRNPVKSDIRSARPAGAFFTEGGNLYRPSQDSSRQYGGRICIQHVMKLSETEFEEETVNVIEPVKNSPYKAGIHTINQTANWIVIDGKRRKFTLNKILSRA